MENLEQHAAAVEAAGTTLATTRASFFRDGQPIYAPEEMQRRDAEAEAVFRRTFTAAGEAAGAEIADAEDGLHALDRREADPLSALSAPDVSHARSLAGFIREDAESLGVGTLADRVEDAARENDRAAWALYARYGQRRLEVEQTKPGGGYGDDTARLEAALNLLRARLFVGHGEKRAALMGRRDAAAQLQSHAQATKYIQERYGTTGR